MKNKKTPVTIGIPVYNEEINIGNILLSILKQHQTKFKLEKIIVVSDHSTDATNKIINKINNDKIILLINNKRKGKSFCLDRIIDLSHSDILVFIDADTIITDSHFLNKICDPITKGIADLTSPVVEELKPKTFVQKILYASMKFKKTMYYGFNNGINVYTCHGRTLGFSKKLYKLNRFTDVVVDDAYSYFYCKYNNFKYIPVTSTSVSYALPATFSDHEKQSIRFFKSYDNLSNKFSNKIIKSEYDIPKKAVVYAFLQTVFRYPLLLLYIPIATFLKIKSLFVNFQSAKWDIAKSSKKNIYV